MEETIEQDGIRGVLHRPDSGNGDAIALTHGASSNAGAPLLVRLAKSFAESGYLVLRYDLPFRQRGRGAPHPAHAARDREGIALAIQALRNQVRGRVIAGGQSYGGRQTTMIAAERADLADALLLLAYPLHPPGKPDQKRTEHFPGLRTPALFVHGTRDPFASPEELREALALIPARTELLVVEGAGHDLKRAADLAPEIQTRLRTLL
jgi:predicted alpha/beta-hydrolase family hydrolase